MTRIHMVQIVESITRLETQMHEIDNTYLLTEQQLYS